MGKTSGSLTSIDLNSDMKTEELDSVLSPDKEKKIAEGDEEEKPQDVDGRTKFSRKAAACWYHFKQLKIEVVMFVYMFSYMARGVTSTGMIIDKVCLVHFKYSEDICKNLANHTDIKNDVDILANNYQLGHTLIQILPSAFLICFIGPWTDHYGRKLPMILAFIGIIIDGLGSTICAHFMYSRVEYYFIPAIFNGISGGFVCVLTVVYSYVSDITTAADRTMKYAIMEMAFGFAMPLGSVAGGWIYNFSGYVPVFLVSTAGHVFGLAWTLFVLPETRGIGNTDSWRVKLKQLWSTEAFMESFRVTMKKRPNKGRKQIFLLIAAMSIIVLTQASSGSLMFLYVHHVYDWDNPKYSTVSAVYAVFGIVTMMIAVPLLKKLKAGDATLGIVGSVSLLVKSIGIGIATKAEIYFLANFAGLLSSLASLAGRTRISKVVSKNDLGKVFSFVTTAEMLGPIIATIVFSQVFNATLKIYPGMMFLILGGLISISLGIFIWLAFLPSVNYEEMAEDQESAEKTIDTGNDKNLKSEKNVIV